MKIIETEQDILELDDELYYKAHCISSDCKLGAGLAADIEKKYHVRERLLECTLYARSVGSCILVDNIFNLITKPYYNYKPSYDSLNMALIRLRAQVNAFKIKHLAIPLLGCGLDKLEWEKVKFLIDNVFEDIDVEITVCRKPKKMKRGD